ncbi:hypothetical protein LCGC14_2369110 [marine sediment metagenome]|uniref:Uncharacterized protein n=1 Tax=marine sediment metagenome TaxID=412755 RepID=A0A0F9C4H0_9ZZZZ
MEKVIPQTQQEGEQNLKELVGELGEVSYKRAVAKLGYEKYFDWVQRYWTSRGESLDFEDHKYLLQIYQDQTQIIM